MDKFFCIKLIKKNGERGYVMDSPNGIMISEGGVTGGLKQFETSYDALQFVKDNKLENNQVKAHIRDNDDLIREEEVGTSVQDRDLYYIENELGERAFYDTKTEGYYFKTGTVGSCVWESEEQCEEFIKAMEFPFKINIKKLENKNK